MVLHVVQPLARLSRISQQSGVLCVTVILYCGVVVPSTDGGRMNNNRIEWNSDTIK